jgi:hypothetical protein
VECGGFDAALHRLPTVRACNADFLTEALLDLFLKDHEPGQPWFPMRKLGGRF